MESSSDPVSVPFQGRRVEVVLATPADLLVLTDWCDLVITGDYHFKRRHMANILERGTSATWCVLVDGVFSGMLILYRGSMLHNLYLAPDVRLIGLGAALLDHFKPQLVRAKSNMKDGDPVPFYEKNGYAVASRDPLKPHIAIMERRPEGEAAASRSAVPGRPGDAPPSTPSPAAHGPRAKSEAEATVAAAPAAELKDVTLSAAEAKRRHNTERSRARRAMLKARAAAAAAPPSGPALAAARPADANPAPHADAPSDFMSRFTL
jgi:GNAT superfamily N-acetyltransferase